MNNVNLPRFMIVGTGSGCGKTTITCALLKAMCNRNLKISSFKCGPDYIDPMFHSTIIGTNGGNLDLYMCSEETVKHLFANNSMQTDFSIIEGVMGLYDGLGNSDEYSSNHLSLVTNTPEILVINPKGMSKTIVAQLYGYLKFKNNNIKGIILNQVSEGMYLFFKDMIESELRIKVYGYMPTVNEAVFSSRHLGLITAAEIDDIQTKLDILADRCEKTIDIDGLIALGSDWQKFEYNPINIETIVPPNSVRIAVAKDKSFSFYYEDNISLLKKLGAEIVYFSPMNDQCVPPNINGIIFGGGYPEEYGHVLSENKSMLESVKRCIESGVKVIAECGGFMYLCKQIEDKHRAVHNMVGVFDATAKMTNKLSRFGYITLKARKDNLLCTEGNEINAHEFHYSDSDNNGSAFLAQKKNGKSWECIHAEENIFAGYPHIHLWGNLEFAKNFIRKCEEIEL